MIRAIKEFFNKGLKCQRLGHIPVAKRVIIRREGGAFAVATDYKAEIDYCKRCFKKLTEPKNEQYDSSCQSLTMPSDMFREMRDNGYIVIDKQT